MERLEDTVPARLLLGAPGDHEALAAVLADEGLDAAAFRAVASMMTRLAHDPDTEAEEEREDRLRTAFADFPLPPNVDAAPIIERPRAAAPREAAEAIEAARRLFTRLPGAASGEKETK